MSGKRNSKGKRFAAGAFVLVAGIAVQAQSVNRAQQAGTTGAKAQASQQGVTMPARNAAPSARGVGSGASSSGFGGAISAFHADTGRYPSTAEGLNALVTAPPGVKNWKGPYVTFMRSPGREPFSDPWGNQYKYTNFTTTSTATVRYPSIEIRSLGPDGVENTSDDLVING